MKTELAICCTPFIVSAGSTVCLIGSEFQVSAFTLCNFYVFNICNLFLFCKDILCYFSIQEALPVPGFSSSEISSWARFIPIDIQSHMKWQNGVAKMVSLLEFSSCLTQMASLLLATSHDGYMLSPHSDRMCLWIPVAVNSIGRSIHLHLLLVPPRSNGWTIEKQDARWDGLVLTRQGQFFISENHNHYFLKVLAIWNLQYVVDCDIFSVLVLGFGSMQFA